MYVKTAELSPIIKRFIHQHNAEHPQRVGGNQFQTVHVPVMPGRDYVCKRAGIGDTRLNKIINNEYDTVPFDIADRIMCAIDRPEVFTNGEVKILCG